MQVLINNISTQLPDEPRDAKRYPLINLAVSTFLLFISGFWTPKWPLLSFSFQGVSPQVHEQRSKGDRKKQVVPLSRGPMGASRGTNTLIVFNGKLYERHFYWNCATLMTSALNLTFSNLIRYDHIVMRSLSPEQLEDCLRRGPQMIETIQDQKYCLTGGARAVSIVPTSLNTIVTEQKQFSIAQFIL